MIKNRTAQLIFYTVYCTLGLIGFAASLGIFDILAVAFAAVGFMFFGLDKLGKKKG